MELKEALENTLIREEELGGIIPAKLDEIIAGVERQMKIFPYDDKIRTQLESYRTIKEVLR